MVDNVENSLENRSGPESPVDFTRIEYFEGIGELTVGVGSNVHIIVAALCMLDDPRLNRFFLAQKLKLSDRITKTKIFPREGMALPNGEVYHEPEEDKGR